MLQDTPTEAMITTKEAARLIKEARASSQTKCHFDNCPALANTCEAHATGLWKVSEKEAYANGVREGQRSKTAFKMGVESVTKTCSDCQKVQRKKGQADLKHKETKPEKPPPYTCQECGERHCWITEANRSHKKTKPENAFELQYCEIHNQMTNHINKVCQKCKPEWKVRK